MFALLFSNSALAERANIAWAFRTCTMPHLPNQTRIPVWRRRESTTCTQNAHTHRGAARPQAARILNGSMHASGRSCASNEGWTNTLPALPLRAARGEHGSGANMPLLLSSMTLQIPSRDSPDKSWQPAKLQFFRTRKLLVRQKTATGL